MDSRLDRLERRVEELIARLGGDAPAEPQAAARDDALWVLDGLRSRYPDGAVVYSGHGAFAAGPVQWQMGATVDGLLESDWGAVAPVVAALGHPIRLQLLHAILSGAETVAELGDGLGTTGQLYHHLGQLVAQGWLVAAGRGRYRIPAERVVPLLAIVSAARRAS